LPRVAVLVTAWDMLDNQRSAAGPSAFLRCEYPLFGGRLRDTSKLQVRVFGVSVVGGDLDADKDFRTRFLEGELNTAGYVMTESPNGITKELDLTVPLAWLIRG